VTGNQDTSFAARQGRVTGLLVALITLLISGSAFGQARGDVPPGFSMGFDTPTIGPGSASILRYNIDEDAGEGVVDLSFVNTLPAGLTLAAASGAFSSCGAGTLIAVPGSATISFSGGTVAAFASCEIRVLVTGSMTGTFTNVTGDLTSSAGNSGTASADLTIAADRPGFSKSFSNPTAALGQRQRLTFTIDNVGNTNPATNITFTDALPSGLALADPVNANDSCDASITSPFPIDYEGGILSAEPGGSVISLAVGPFPNAAAVNPGETCTISVDVVSSSVGTLANISESLGSAPPFGIPTMSGRAVASLDSQAGSIVLIKEFLDDPTAPGGSVDLRFTILNRSGTEQATDITFTDDLDAVLAGLVATGLPGNDICGAGSQLSGSSTLTLTGGLLESRSECSFAVTLQIPSGATPGVYANTSSAIEADFGAGPVLGNSARDDLFVFAAPQLSMVFLQDPAPAGGSTTIEYTIENTSTTSAATELTFTDELTEFLPTPLSVTLPPAGFCGPGSSMNIIPLGIGAQGIEVNNAELPSSGSCTFELGVDLPPSASPATITNSTGVISGVVAGDSVTGNAAQATLQILAPPQLTKTFIDDPVQPGAAIELEFTLRYNESATAAATAIAFTDNLEATLTGLVATGLPLIDVCGTGSEIAGTSSLALTGASLLPGQSCSFRVLLQVSAAAVPGAYANTTSAPTATILGEMATGLAASDTLNISSVSFDKAFINDPALPGGMVTLRYTLRNDSASTSATAIQFTDNLDGALTDLAGVGLPLNDICGTGSQLLGAMSNEFLTFSGGSLAPGETCMFDVGLQVPPNAVSNSYNSTTSSLSVVIDGGSPLLLPPATDILVVDDLRLQLVKSFLDDPAGPGDNVTLEFTLDNLDQDSVVSGIVFTDDLNSALAGLQATGLPVNGVCGAGSVLAGTGVLSLSGGMLPAGGQCVFSVTLQLPLSLPVTGSVNNTTSEVTGLLGGLAVRGDPASDDLQLQSLQFDKAFAGPTVAGGAVSLEYTIINPDAISPVQGLAFSDSLSSVIPGLTAIGVPMNNVCGAGSQLSGSGLLTLNNASLAPGGSCTFSVTLQVPPAAVPGNYPSTSSSLTSGGLEVAPPAMATLTVAPAPQFSKQFAASPIAAGAITTLTFSIDNSASVLAASALSFNDPLPAGLVVADPPSPNSTCDGSINAMPGSTAIAFSGGLVAAGGSCTVSIDVRALAAGTLTNITSPLSSSSGSSAAAMANIVVQSAPVPLFSKTFIPDSVAVGVGSELLFQIDNSSALLDATDLAFTDAFPAGLQIADPPALNNGCGGNVTANAGSSSLTLVNGNVLAATVCTISVQVLATTPGTLVNTTSTLESSLGSSAAATDTLIARTAPGFSKAFDPDQIAGGETTLLTFTIDNSAETVAAEQLSFVDNLPPGLLIDTPSAATTNCTGGVLTAVAGGSAISYSDGIVAGAAVCTVVVAISSEVPGNYINVSEPLTSTLGDSGTATAALLVTEDSDGIPAAVENQAPNNGDGNNDGIADGIQDDVASLPAFDGSGFITVVTGGGCDTLTQVQALAPASQASPPPAGEVFPFGLIGFALPCENALVDVIFHDAQEDFSDRYFKFGPTTPGDPGSLVWYEFDDASLAGNVWTLTLADNALGDSSGDDGIINDPGGPARRLLAEPEAVPALGARTLALLALLLLLTAALHSRFFSIVTYRT